jgi:hypothetical protein
MFSRIHVQARRIASRTPWIKLAVAFIVSFDAALEILDVDFARAPFLSARRTLRSEQDEGRLPIARFREGWG